MQVDVVIVGAGVVGLACARRLQQAGLETIVIERNARAGQETTSRNSQVLHAGLYYPEGSAKARHCVAGNRSLHAYCDARGIAAPRIGKLVVACSDEDIAQLERIHARGSANGATDLALIDAARVRELEPNVRCVAAMWSPNTGIVDAHRIVRSLESEAVASGAEIAFMHRVEKAIPSGGGYELTVVDARGTPTPLRSSRVVNAAGLDADFVAALPGLDIDALGYRQHFVKGSYFRVHPRRGALVTHLVYPVPPPALRGLGVHVTLDLDGSLRLGPDVEACDGRVFSYEVDGEKAISFHRAASRYLDGFGVDDLLPDQSGIRPKLRGVGDAPADFVIAHEAARGLPGWVNLVGIESPGLTCCLEIADDVAAQLGVS